MPLQTTLWNSRVLAEMNSNIAPTPAPQTGQKRKIDDPIPVEMFDDDEDEDDMLAGMPITDTCGQVRAKIKRFLNSGEMTQKAFAIKIGVTDHSLRTFLKQTGKFAGEGSNTYPYAWGFFKKREMAGLKTPTKKKQKTDAAVAGEKRVKEAGNSAGVNISGIHLDGEDTDSVPVYETCKEIRHKINLYLKKPGVTQAQFCRDLRSQLHSPSAPGDIQTVQLARFRSREGSIGGNTSSVYYAAYVFFEKVRIKEGKEKSRHRLEMEKIWPNGTDRVNSSSRSFLCSANVRPYFDEYGRYGLVRI